MTSHSRSKLSLLALAALLLCVGSAVAAENIDPGNDGSQYAWGENVGWLNLEPQGDGGPGTEVSAAGLAGWIWAENAGWISLSCQNTSSCGTVSYGVTNDGKGVLGGYAWAENAGWISFSCANTGSCGSGDYGVTIDPQTGIFAGDAWGENVGWLRFASTGANPFTIRTSWTCPIPLDPLNLTGGKSGADIQLTWSAVAGATAYDVLQGDLDLLVSAGGDFTAATTSCVADDQAATTSVIAGDPAPGSGFWWLVRPVDCNAGSYDSSGGGQLGLRDAEISAAPGACP